MKYLNFIHSNKKNIYGKVKKNVLHVFFASCFLNKMFFIDCLSDDEVAQFLKFKTSEKGRKAGYKQIKNLKKMLYLKAQYLLKSNDLFSS